jgi:5'-phosphate synthase pdxT subunit
MVRIGVLALQGAFREHVERLQSLSGVEVIEVRTPAQLESVDGLLIPGGESTAMALIAEASGLLEPLRAFVRNSHKAVWGTCAGLIMLSEHVEGQKAGGQAVLGGLDVSTARNYFGCQLNSFVADTLTVPALEDGDTKPFPAVFIRAPAVTAVHSPNVEVLATVPAKPTDAQHKEVIVAVRQGRLLGTAFHPELTDDPRWHQLFVDMTKRVMASDSPDVCNA